MNSLCVHVKPFPKNIHAHVLLNTTYPILAWTYTTVHMHKNALTHIVKSTTVHSKKKPRKLSKKKKKEKKREPF